MHQEGPRETERGPKSSNLRALLTRHPAIPDQLDSSSFTSMGASTEEMGRLLDSVSVQVQSTHRQAPCVNGLAYFDPLTR
jgi:hypothetical protein